MKKLWKNLIGWVVYFAVLAGLIFGIPKALSYFLKTEHPMASITSRSMWPALKRGDLIFIKGVGGREEVSAGEIVVYKNPEGFTVHRVVEMRENTFVSKGDANNIKDSPVRYEELVGKALTFRGKLVRIPLLGFVSLYFGKVNL